MSQVHRSMPRWATFVPAMTLLLWASSAAAQQPQMPGMEPQGQIMMCRCPMNGPMGTFAMALGGLLVLAAVAALLALTVFLIRRSAPRSLVHPGD